MSLDFRTVHLYADLSDCRFEGFVVEDSETLMAYVSLFPRDRSKVMCIEALQMDELFEGSSYEGAFMDRLVEIFDTTAQIDKVVLVPRQKDEMKWNEQFIRFYQQLGFLVVNEKDNNKRVMVLETPKYYAKNKYQN
ncbi:hypothetical protein CN514_17015 [Bacillus sp. AFS001701]|uniref:GNAT family N-acetyltransferase n=1 Tax=Bacillaceae TaxID=186817 RepID=UPI000BF43225|nr:GNAT family N-acetyltransferase [Bacillus sp. AFS001701]PET55220.1 hypothetical protein CN514_17015 [Bacillus sp. AFS001701]